MMFRMEIAADAEDQWGYLVKTWATGRSYFPNDQSTVDVSADKLRPPRDLDDFKAQLRLIGIHEKVKIPEHVTSVAVIQYSPNILALRLPPKEMVEASERFFEESGAGAYKIGSFYASLTSPQPLSVAEKKRLHACRIGDYSVSSCL